MSKTGLKVKRKRWVILDSLIIEVMNESVPINYVKQKARIQKEKEKKDATLTSILYSTCLQTSVVLAVNYDPQPF